MSGLLSGLFALLYSFFFGFGNGSFWGSETVCSRSLEGDTYLVTPRCFEENNLPQLGFQESANLIWPSVERFDNLYELDKQEFSYYGASPVMKKNFSAQDLSALKNNRLLLKRYNLIGESVRVNKNDLAYDQFKKFTFYGAERQIDNYGDCSRINYLVALKKLEGLYLEPGEKYTINDALSNQPNYCMGSVPGKYLFYQGVCGASTQLFRVSLLMPDIQITERANHSQRY
ncbi:MAG TPA: VanW family protein, partial [Candidatus Absconditabacterales bacterium]|nr:VanW family protein [Candidatus Absconditabacterales bacterium]